MKIGAEGSLLLDPNNLKESFAIFQEVGFDCIDFDLGSFWNPKSPAESILFWEEQKLLEFFRAYKEAAAENHIEFGQAHAPFPTYIKNNEETNRLLLIALERCIRICGYLECTHLIIHPAFCDYAQRLDSETEWELNIKRYGELIPALRQYKVTACLENMFTGYRGKIYDGCCSDFSEACRYIDTLNEMAGETLFAFCFDTGHALLLGKNVEAAIEQLGHRIQTLHVHDNNGMQDQHLFPYMGIFDWQRFCQSLRKINYRGNFSFEASSTLNVIDPALRVQSMRFLLEIGKYFVSCIE